MSITISDEIGTTVRCYTTSDSHFRVGQLQLKQGIYMVKVTLENKLSQVKNLVIY